MKRNAMEKLTWEDLQEKHRVLKGSAPPDSGYYVILKGVEEISLAYFMEQVNPRTPRSKKWSRRRERKLVKRAVRWGNTKGKLWDPQRVRFGTFTKHLGDGGWFQVAADTGNGYTMDIHDQIAIKNGHTPMEFPETCQHDYENPIRLGRANYVCRKCNTNITLALVLIAQLEMDVE